MTIRQTLGTKYFELTLLIEMGNNMNIEAQKLSLIKQLMHVQDKTTLNRIREILKEERVSAYQRRLNSMSVEELEEKLSQSEQDIKDGRVYSTDEVKALFKNRDNG